MEEFNVIVFSLINKYAGIYAWVDLLGVTLAEYTPYFFILLSVYLWFRGDLVGRRASYLAALSTLLSMCLSYITSLFYTHHRPFVEGLGTQLVNHAPDTSFPSDHTTFIFAVFTAILFDVPGKFLKGARFAWRGCQGIYWRALPIRYCFRNACWRSILSDIDPYVAVSPASIQFLRGNIFKTHACLCIQAREAR